MVALDNHARDAKALYAVGIDCALCQPFCVGYFLRLGVEHLHKVAAYDFTFLLRVAHTFQILEELVACVHSDYVQAESLVCLHNLLELVFAQHTVVYEYTRKV